MVIQMNAMQQTQLESELLHNVQQQTDVAVRSSSDLILLVSTLAVQLHQTQEELEESHQLLDLMREKLTRLEPLESQLIQTQAELERSRSVAEQFRAEKEWLALKYQALRETAQQLQKELKLAQNQQQPQNPIAK